MSKIDLTIKLDDVLTAYNGRVGCMCGCNGDYAYNSKYQKEGGDDRGYPVDDDEVSDRKVNTRINRLVKLMKDEDYDKLDINLDGKRKYVYLERAGRCICLYLKAS